MHNQNSRPSALCHLFLLCVGICFCLHGKAQFVRIPANGEIISASTKTKSAGDNDFICLFGGELYHITLSASGLLHLEWIDNSLLYLFDFVLHDIDQDGDQDILCYQKEVGKFGVYLKVNGRYQYSLDYPIVSNGPYAIHSQDFSGDGIDDLMINHGFFVTTGINEREQVWRYPVANPTTYKYTFMFDYQQDGDVDALFHVGNSLYILEHTGADFSLTIKSVLEAGDMVSWGRMISTPVGKRLFYYDAGGDRIRQTVFTPEGLEFRDMLSVNLTATHDHVSVFDINQDGTDEIVLYSTNPSRLMIFAYDAILDSMMMTETEIPNPGNVATGVVFKNNLPFLFCIGGVESRMYRIEDDFRLTQDYVLPSGLSPQDGGLVDFDGDGYVDIVSENFVRPYSAMQQFADPVQVTFPPVDGSLRDFDLDGDIDYVTDSSWYENAGQYTFGPEISIADPTPDPGIDGLREILRADIDQDGDLDILTYSAFNMPLELLANTGNSYFESPSVLASPSEINGTLVHVEVTDIDNDGDHDIVFAAKSGLIVIRNAGGLDFQSPVQVYSNSKIPHTVDVADINSDGWSDIILGTKNTVQGSGIGEAIFFKGGPGPWQSQWIHEGPRQHLVAFANVNNSGWLDIMIEHEEGLFWASTNNGIEFIVEKIDDHLEDHVKLVALDVDQDGDDDAIVYEANSTILNYYINGVTGILLQTCPSGDVYIRNAVQAKQYALRYPLCEYLPGSLYVGGDYDWADITDISMFRRIREVQGDFTFRNHNLIDELTGFSSLERVGGSFGITSYKSNHLHGLEQLRYVGLDFTLSGLYPSTGKVNLEELENLDTIGRHVLINSSRISHIGPIIQPVFHGDIRLSNLPDLDDEFTLGRIDTIRGELELNDCAITSFDSLHDIRSIGSLRILNTSLRDFGAFRHIRHIEGDVYILYNDLLKLTSGFDSLQTVGGSFVVGVDTCSVFERLTSVGGHFQIIATRIGPASFNQLDLVGDGVYVTTTSMVDMQNFRSLSSAGGDLHIANCKQLTTLDGLQTLREPLSELVIQGNSRLSSINALYDSLDVAGPMTIINNSSLHACDDPFICRHISLGGDLTVHQNGVDCSDISDIRCLNTIFSGFVYHDGNENAIKDQHEATLSNIRVIIEHEQDTMITGHNGYFRVHATEGDSLQVSLTVPDQWNATTNTQIKVDSFIPGDPMNYGNNFGLKPGFEKHDVSMTWNQGLFLCDREYVMDITITNKGTFSEWLEVEIHYPEYIALVDTFTDFTEHDEMNRVIRIKLDTLYPFFSRTLSIPFIAPDATHVTEIFSMEIVILDVLPATPIVLDHQVSEVVLLCSFDPNDKLVRSTNGTKDVHLNSDDVLLYTIRFQNTGNYFAQHVRIVDTLSTLFDMTSLAYLASSHPLEIRVEGHVVHFLFYDIFLPDSTLDLTGSQGYVTFQIKPLSSDMAGELFKNKADIYFDYNPSILTNETISEVVDLSLVLDPADRTPYQIVPNPVSESFHIDPVPGNKPLYGFFTIYSASGSVAREGIYDGRSISAAGLSTGVYYVRLYGYEDSGTVLCFVKADR